MGRVVESPQGADTPRVGEENRGDKTLGGTTGTEDEPREDRRGRGWGENSPTAQSIRTQEANDGEGGLIGGPQTAEPLGTEM